MMTTIRFSTISIQIRVLILVDIDTYQVVDESRWAHSPIRLSSFFHQNNFFFYKKEFDICISHYSIWVEFYFMFLFDVVTFICKINSGILKILHFIFHRKIVLYLIAVKTTYFNGVYGDQYDIY